MSGTPLAVCPAQPDGHQPLEDAQQAAIGDMQDARRIVLRGAALEEGEFVGARSLATVATVATL